MLAILLSLVLIMSFYENENYGYEILATGSFFEGEVESQSGEMWLGLFNTAEGYELRAVELTVIAEHSLADRTDEEKTGKCVFVANEEGKLLFLLRSQERVFSEGPVYPEIVKSGDLGIGISRPIGETAEIFTIAKGLYFTDGVNIQRLSDVYPDSHGEGVAVVWAGDLDGDNKIDIVLNDRPHNAFKHFYRLFLSSEASEGELLKEVAQFVTVSC